MKGNSYALKSPWITSHIQRSIKFIWKLGDLYLESLLNFQKHLFVCLFAFFFFVVCCVFIWFYEVNCETLCSESACSTNSMKICVSISWEIFDKIIIYHNWWPSWLFRYRYLDRKDLWQQEVWNCWLWNCRSFWFFIIVSKLSEYRLGWKASCSIIQ